MKRRRLTVLSILLAGAMVLSITGCGSNAGSDKGDASGENTTSGPIDIVFGSSQATGTFYQLAVATANIINKNNDLGINVTNITTTNGTENALMMKNGEIQMAGNGGYTTYGIAAGVGATADMGPVDINILYACYPDYYQVMVPKNSDINSMSDLVGKTINVDVEGSSAQALTELYFDAWGITKDQYTESHLVNADAADSLQDGNIDAIVFIGGAGSSLGMQLAASNKGLKIVPMTDEEIAKLEESVPIGHGTVLPAGSYEGIDELKTFGASTVMYVSPDLSEDVVYEMVKALDEHNSDLTVVMPTAVYATAENTMKDWADSAVPLHPGLIKYLKEKGLM